MQKEDLNFNGYWELFKLTGNILFATTALYVKRTQNNITLEDKKEELTL